MTLKASPLGNRVVWAERIPPDGCQRVVALWKSAPTLHTLLLGHPSRVRCLGVPHRGYSPHSHAPVTERRRLQCLNMPSQPKITQVTTILFPSCMFFCSYIIKLHTEIRSAFVPLFRGRAKKLRRVYQEVGSNIISTPGNFISNPGNFISKAWK